VAWLDAEMTPRGIAQVLASNAFWQDVAPIEQIPFPVSFYVSPMARTLATGNLTFGSLGLWTESKPFAPIVKEVSYSREIWSVANCIVPSRNNQRLHVCMATSEEVDL
jgi:hypothetical protein